MCMSSYPFRHSMFNGLRMLVILLLLGFIHVDYSDFSYTISDYAIHADSCFAFSVVHQATIYF
jgi:hypothetical protein